MDHADIAEVLSQNSTEKITNSTVKYHYQIYKAEKKGIVGLNGRPRHLTEDEIQKLKNYLEDLIIPPKPNEILQFINKEFKKCINERSLSTILKRINYSIEICRPMEVINLSVFNMNNSGARKS